MKMQGRMLAAVAAFVFGSATVLGANAAQNACQLCWDAYHRCKGTPEQCEGRLTECLRQGDGKLPCPLV